MKDYYIKNIEKCRAYGRNYYYQHKEQVKEYLLKNREKIKEYNKQYSLKNKEKKKEYRLKNREQARQWHKEYYQRNKERLKDKRFQKELGVGVEVTFQRGPASKPSQCTSQPLIDQDHCSGIRKNNEMG
tara:strand:- start:208 stop:594 length:387 start_codon:yes stop_codon:yes gene_type:complete